MERSGEVGVSEEKLERVINLHELYKRAKEMGEGDIGIIHSTFIKRGYVGHVFNYLPWCPTPYKRSDKEGLEKAVRGAFYNAEELFSRMRELYPNEYADSEYLRVIEAIIKGGKEILDTYQNKGLEDAYKVAVGLNLELLQVAERNSVSLPSTLSSLSEESYSSPYFLGSHPLILGRFVNSQRIRGSVEESTDRRYAYQLLKTDIGEIAKDLTSPQDYLDHTMAGLLHHLAAFYHYAKSELEKRIKEEYTPQNTN